MSPWPCGPGEPLWEGWSMGTLGSGDLVDQLPRAPRRQPLGEEVYESLKTLIMDHRIEPEVRLNVDALTRELDTSSTPVREALARLEADGLARKLPRRGHEVAPVLDREQILELYELRLLVEPWAAGRAAERVSAGSIRRLREDALPDQDAPESTGHEAYKHFSGNDARMHDLILELAGNETIRETFARRNIHLHLYRVSYGKEIGLHAVEEHRAIVEAITSRDKDTAMEAMEQHLRLARDRLAAAAGERPSIGNQEGA